MSVKRFVGGHVKEIVTIGIIALIFLACIIARPEMFDKSRIPSIVNSILFWMPLNLTVAMGMMMVVIVRDIDLSVGSNVALSAMIAGIMFRDLGSPLWLGVIAAIAVGALCGAFNGFLIAHLNIPAIIVTLGTMNAYRGLTYIVSAGRQVTNYELPDMNYLVTRGISAGEFLAPWIVLIAFLIVIAFSFLMRYSHFGREIYAVGSNREAAHLRGIDCKRTEFLIFLIVGALCGVTAIMSAARFGYVNPSNTGNGLEFVVISATIIGGVSVSGGSGTVLGVFLGCLLLGTVNNMITVMAIPGTVQRFSYGMIIALSLLIDWGVRAVQSRQRIRELERKEAVP